MIYDETLSKFAIFEKIYRGSLTQNYEHLQSETRVPTARTEWSTIAEKIFYNQHLTYHGNQNNARFRETPPPHGRIQIFRSFATGGLSQSVVSLEIVYRIQFSMNFHGGRFHLKIFIAESR